LFHWGSASLPFFFSSVLLLVAVLVAASYARRFSASFR
jgi:hypothetical protein